MKKTIIAAAIAVGLGGTSAIADGHANSVSLQLQWVTQAQFAGYYVALGQRVL
jgi:NitT/TauT family transport system substrate-binding protein